MIQFKAKSASGEIIKSALTPFTFPDGQAFTKREDRRDLEPTEIAALYGTDDMHADLFQLAMWNNYLREESPRTKRVLILPYIPGARSDRGNPLSLEVYADFINDLRLDQVIVFDPHSPKSVELLRAKTVTVVHSDELFNSLWGPDLSKFDGIIAPDAGAVERATAVAKLYNLPVYTAAKHRNPDNGNLSGFKIDLPEGTWSLPNRYLVVDDICDGGGTFIGLAEATGLDREQLHLFVSHGVFSKMALDNLPRHFARVHTTNSFNPNRDLNYDSIDYPVYVRHNILSLLFEKVK